MSLDTIQPSRVNKAGTWNFTGTLQKDGSNVITEATQSGVSDGDKGDITVSGGGATFTIDNDVVTYAKMQNVSANSRLLGRISGGSGDPEEVILDTDGTLAANSDTRAASQKAVKTYVDTAVTGLLDFKGATDASSNPNYPAASKGDAYIISVAGKIGGASGKSVDIGDIYVASADNAGGTEAAVGTSWFVLEHNLVGALLSANNLSDLADAATARTNLGLGTMATETATNYLQKAGGTLTGEVNLGENAGIAVDAALSADGKYSAESVEDGTAGTTLAFGDLVYRASADSRWELADADAEATSGGVRLGICVLAAAGDGSATKILRKGRVRADTAFPALTPDAPVYVSTTAGDIQVAAPSGTDDVIRVVGYATTADEIDFDPENSYTTHI